MYNLLDKQYFRHVSGMSQMKTTAIPVADYCTWHITMTS